MQNKKVIIVGATSGIGRELAMILARSGNIVGITGRRIELLQTLQSSFPQNIYLSSFDIRNTDECADRLTKLATAMKGMDMLILSAGSGTPNEMLDFAVEKEMIDLNVSGFTCVVDWAFNYFKNQGYGHLAAISSIAGLRGIRHAPGYSATKAYQINYLQALRQKAQRERSNIIVTDIRPGFVNTPSNKSPVKFWVAPVDKAARQILSALQNQKKVVYLAKRWKILALLYQWLPGLLHERL